MASQESVEALRGLVARLDVLATKVEAVEKISLTLKVTGGSGQQEQRLTALLTRLHAVEAKLSGASRSSGNGLGSLEELVSGFESVSLSLEKALKPSSAQVTIPSTLAAISSVPPTVTATTAAAAAAAAALKTEETKIATPNKEAAAPRPSSAVASPAASVMATATATASKEADPAPKRKEEAEPKKQEATPAKAETSTTSAAPSTAASPDTPAQQGKPFAVVVQTGNMEKLGGGLIKKWQTRKFELTEDTLHWTLPGGDHEQNSLALADIKAVVAVEEKKFKRPRVFEVVTPKKTYNLMAPDDASLQQWMANLNKTPKTDSK